MRSVSIAISSKAVDVRGQRTLTGDARHSARARARHRRVARERFDRPAPVAPASKMRARGLSVSRCSSVTCGVGGGRVGLAAGRGEETHGDAVARPPKSGIARKATEAVGARGLARFGDAETCARDLPPLSAAGELSEHCPKGREGNQKTWGSDTRASDAPRRVSGVCGWGSARLARSWRGGEYRARGRRACQDWAWRATAALVWSQRFFFDHVLAASGAPRGSPASTNPSRVPNLDRQRQRTPHGNVVVRRREERGFRLTEKIIGHVQNVIKPDCGLVRLSQTNLRFTAGADAAAFRSSRARVSRPPLPLAPDTPPRPARAPPLRRRDTGEGNAAGDFERAGRPTPPGASPPTRPTPQLTDKSPWASAARR